MADLATRSHAGGSLSRPSASCACPAAVVACTKPALPAGIRVVARLLRDRAPAASLLGSLLLLAQAAPVMAQSSSGFGPPLGVSAQDRQIFGNGGGSGSGVGPGGSSSGIDLNNPIDLINRLRRSTALDDATPPASAVDQAIKALEAQSVPARVAPPAGSPAPSAPAAGPRPAASRPTLPGSP